MTNLNKLVKYKFLFYVEQNYSFDILRPLQEIARLNGHRVYWLLVGPDVSATLLLDDELHFETIHEAVTYHPDAVFAPGDRIPSFISGLKVQVFHGLNESKRGNVYPERGLFDLYCTEGHERTNSLQKIADKKGYFKVIETGWIKLDSLFNYKKIHQPEEFDRPQVLFASTFSPSLSSAELAFNEIKRLSQSNKWQWLVTLHPKMSKETVAKYQSLQSDNLTFMDNDRVIESLNRADVMVCDNSSIFQEFLLLNKPVVTINNRDPLSCFININDPQMLEETLESALNPSAELLDDIRGYGPSVTPYLDGESSARVLKAVASLLESNWVNKKPLNLLRNLKIRKKLKYWRRG